MVHSHENKCDVVEKNKTKTFKGETVLCVLKEGGVTSDKKKKFLKEKCLNYDAS